jgi:16S rRNA processing protein RimM
MPLPPHRLRRRSPPRGRNRLPPLRNEKSKADLGEGRVSAGRIVGAFGLAGELKVEASRVGEDALRPGLAVTLRFDDGRTREATIATVRRHKGRPLVRIDDIADATAAEALGHADLLIARDDAPLHEGEYFDADLVGCRLIDADGTVRGEVAQVAHYPAQDMLVLGRGVLLPLVRAFIARVDIARKEIHVTVPPGLLDPAEADQA